MVLAASVAAGGCSHGGGRYVVGGPVAPPAKPAYQPYVPTRVASDDFVTAAGSNAVFFATASSHLDARAREVLDRQAAWIVTHRGPRILIEGHADERASTSYNLELGRDRARSVVDYFVAKGVPRERFVARSFGEGKPIVDQPGDVEINRRAVTVVMGGADAPDAYAPSLPSVPAASGAAD